MKRLYDLDFARNRLNGTIIMIDNRPHYIQDCYRDDNGNIILDAWCGNGKSIRINHEDDSVTHNPPATGWYYTGNNKMKFNRRLGQRQWKMGIRLPSNMDFEKSYDILSGKRFKYNNEQNIILSANWAVQNGILYFKEVPVAVPIAGKFVFPKELSFFSVLYNKVFGEVK